MIHLDYFLSTYDWACTDWWYHKPVSWTRVWASLEDPSRFSMWRYHLIFKYTATVIDVIYQVHQTDTLVRKHLVLITCIACHPATCRDVSGCSPWVAVVPELDEGSVGRKKSQSTDKEQVLRSDSPNKTEPVKLVAGWFGHLGTSLIRKYGVDWMKNEVVPPIIKGDQTCAAWQCPGPLPFERDGE